MITLFRDIAYFGRRENVKQIPEISRDDRHEIQVTNRT